MNGYPWQSVAGGMLQARGTDYLMRVWPVESRWGLGWVAMATTPAGEIMCGTLWGAPWEAQRSAERALRLALTAAAAGEALPNVVQDFFGGEG